MHNRKNKKSINLHAVFAAKYFCIFEKKAAFDVELAANKRKRLDLLQVIKARKQKLEINLSTEFEQRANSKTEEQFEEAVTSKQEVKKGLLQTEKNALDLIQRLEAKRGINLLAQFTAQRRRINLFQEASEVSIDLEKEFKRVSCSILKLFDQPIAKKTISLFSHFNNSKLKTGNLFSAFKTPQPFQMAIQQNELDAQDEHSMEEAKKKRPSSTDFGVEGEKKKFK